MPLNNSVEFTATTPGTVPKSGGGTVNFIRADGTWAAPGGGTSVHYATLAAMRAAGPPSVGIFNAVLLNRAVAFDGGGGDFTWLTGLATSPADDDCTVIRPAGAPGGAAWVRRFQGAVNILWAGGIADNATDNTTAFINADAAAQNTSLGATAARFHSPNGQIICPVQTVGVPYLILGTANLASDLISTVPNSLLNTVISLGGGTGNLMCGDLTYMAIETTTPGSSLNCMRVISSSILGAPTLTIGDTVIDSDISINNGGPGGFSVQRSPKSYNARFVIDNSFIGTTSSVITFAAGLLDTFIRNSVLNASGSFINGGGANQLYMENCAVTLGDLAGTLGAFYGFNSIQAGDCPATLTTPSAQAVYAATNYVILKNSPVTAGQAVATATFISPSITVPGTPASGAIRQNTAPFPVIATLTATLNGNLALASVIAKLGPVSPPATQADEFVAPLGSVNGVQVSVRVLVPTGWYYSFTGVNAAFNQLNLSAGE